jgi:hypothetical protein
MSSDTMNEEELLEAIESLSITEEELSEIIQTILNKFILFPNCG